MIKTHLERCEGRERGEVRVQERTQLSPEGKRVNKETETNKQDTYSRENMGLKSKPIFFSVVTIHI